LTSILTVRAGSAKLVAGVLADAASAGWMGRVTTAG
jgi:hypothetical protein